MPPALVDRPGPGPGGDRQPRPAICRERGRRELGRGGGDHRAPGDGHRVSRVVGDRDRHRGGADRGRGRGREPPGPGRAGGVPGIGGVAERDQGHLVGRAAPAREHRAGHRAVPEHGLDPDGGARYPVADHRVAPQAELAALVAHQLVGNQPQQRDPADPDPRVTGDRRPPAGQLPPHPLGHRQRGQQAVVPPQPGDLLPVLANHLDLDPHAGQSPVGQAGVHPLGERLGGEHRRLGLLGRRVERHGNGQVDRGRARGQRTGIQAARQPVRGRSVASEPVRRLGGRQRRELPQRPDAQPGQQVGQLRVVQDADRVRSQERRRLARGHDRGPGFPGGPGGEPRGEQAISHADLAGEPAAGRRLDDLPGQGVFPAEVPGRAAGADGAGPRTEHLHPRAESFHHGHHLLECPRVPLYFPSPRPARAPHHKHPP
jgi:hypothetical protein